MKSINTFLNLFNIKFMKSTNTTKIIHSHAIMNFYLACKNLPALTIIDYAFSKDEKLRLNIKDKYEKSPVCNMLDFFIELDLTSRETVIRWIMENYKGVDVANIARYYIKDESEVTNRLNCLFQEKPSLKVLPTKCKKEDNFLG